MNSWPENFPAVDNPLDWMPFTTVQIQTDVGVGTGFFFSFPVGEGKVIEIIATNKHVLENAQEVHFSVHKKQLKGEQIYPEKESKHVTLSRSDLDLLLIEHPDANVDLCGINFIPIREFLKEEEGVELFYGVYTTNNVLSDEELANLQTVEDVLMIGYPIGLWDEENNMPLVRRGITASHPALDFNGKSEFVVDIGAYPGSSGSPIVLASVGTYIDKVRKEVIVGARFGLLGVLYGAPVFNSEGKVLVQPIPTRSPTAVVPQMTHLGFAVKAKEILRLIQPAP